MRESTHNRQSGKLCEPCLVQHRYSLAGVTISALWASGSSTGAPMPLCWEHFHKWRDNFQPIMALALADNDDAWLQLPRNSP